MQLVLFVKGIIQKTEDFLKDSEFSNVRAVVRCSVTMADLADKVQIHREAGG
jgi:hypothetical protein